MLDADGSLKILDFGIARASEAASMTQAGMLIGTLNYMSPEQVSGLPVDLRSDLFAVGAVFYELLSYRQAFPGGLMAGILNKILSGQPDPLPSIVPDIDPEIVRIVERALEKDPGRRYQDLAAMRQDIAVARARLAAEAPTKVLGTTPSVDEVGDTRFTPPPVRRSANLDGLAKRRTEQIQSNLTEAERMLAAGDPDGAIARAEQALLLDAHHPLAHGLIDRARAVIESRQVEAALEAAAADIASGDFALAGQHLDQASSINPQAPRIAEVRRSLDDAVHRREEARQREALEARAREAMAEADTLFAAGRRDDAVARLASFRPSHPLVAQALERLRAEAARLAAAERAEADRLAQINADISSRLAEASRLLDSGQLQPALAKARSVFTIDRDHAEAKGLEGRIEEAIRAEAERRRAEQERLDAEARAAREREKAATAAIKEAKRSRGPEAALAVLRPALERDPDNVDLLRAIGANEAELKRAEAKAAEQARRQAEQAERERAEREKAEREKAAREQAERERAERERAAREKAERDRAAAAAAASVPAVDADDKTIVLHRDEALKPAAPAAPSQSRPRRRPRRPPQRLRHHRRRHRRPNCRCIVSRLGRRRLARRRTRPAPVRCSAAMP